MTEISQKTVAHLLNSSETPLKTRTEEDGTLVVIAANGMKFSFTPDQVQEAEKQTKPAPKPNVPSKPSQSPKTITKKPAAPTQQIP